MKVFHYNVTMSRFEKTTVGKPEPWLIAAAASVGLNLAGLVHEVTNHFVNHSIKEHGNKAIEQARGQLPVTLADIARIPDIVKNPDYALIGIKRHGETIIAYSKKLEEGTAFFYEEVLRSKRNKALRSKTIYKKIGTVNEQTFLNIVTTNLHTDISGAKKVVGAGGNPGGEA
jgi:hypothetical protein